MSARPHHPAPPINRDLAFLYEGFNRGELLVQVCDRCEGLRHPPSPFCPSCHSPAWTARKMSGVGKVYSYTLHHHPAIPPWPLPHAVVLAEMIEGFRFVAAMPDAAPADLAIGQSVRIVFTEVEEGYWLPQFVKGPA